MCAKYRTGQDHYDRAHALLQWGDEANRKYVQPSSLTTVFLCKVYLNFFSFFSYVSVAVHCFNMLLFVSHVQDFHHRLAHLRQPTLYSHNNRHSCCQNHI
jgi:hypothetical protein